MIESLDHPAYRLAVVSGEEAPPDGDLTHRPAPELNLYLAIEQLQSRKGLNGSYPAIGRVIAGSMHLKGLKAGEPIRSIRITRVGQAARDFKTDDEGFGKLMGAKK